MCINDLDNRIYPSSLMWLSVTGRLVSDVSNQPNGLICKSGSVQVWIRLLVGHGELWKWYHNILAENLEPIIQRHGVAPRKENLKIPNHHIYFHAVWGQRQEKDPYANQYFLTPWWRVLLEKLTVLQLVKKFPSFHGTRRFITALTSVRHLSLSWVSPIQSIYPHPTSWRSILISSTHLRLGLPSGLLPSGFPSKTLYTPISSPIRATCPAHLILLDFITRTILCELRKPIPCNYYWFKISEGDVYDDDDDDD